MLPLERGILIYSFTEDHFLVYDRLEQQIRTIELQGIEADEAGFYCSNVLIDQDEFVILPFKGETIRRYGITGKLISKDNIWCSFIDRECNCNGNLCGNIRADSACIVKGELFFSLIYKNQNYLCKYELNNKVHLCNIIYNSEDIIIKGVYKYSDIVIFRRIFSSKTEIVLINLESDERKSFIIDFPTKAEEDIFGDLYHLQGCFKDRILKLKNGCPNSCERTYEFAQSDIYIGNGILFNASKNEIVACDKGDIIKLSIEKIVKDIKNSSSYQRAYRNLFTEKSIGEGRYTLRDLTRYIKEASATLIEKNENKSQGALIWKAI